MLTSIVRVFVNNLVKYNKVFIGKEKKLINVLTIYFFFYKSDVKTFLRLIVNLYYKDTH